LSGSTGTKDPPTAAVGGAAQEPKGMTAAELTASLAIPREQMTPWQREAQDRYDAHVRSLRTDAHYRRQYRPVFQRIALRYGARVACGDGWPPQRVAELHRDTPSAPSAPSGCGRPAAAARPRERRAARSTRRSSATAGASSDDGPAPPPPGAPGARLHARLTPALEAVA
jgi:hypothetical protein